MRTTHNGLTVEVEVDDISENPREPIGTMVCWHRRYRLGDEHDFDTPRDFQESDMKRAYVVLPIYLYDHSMLALSTEKFCRTSRSRRVGQRSSRVYLYFTRKGERTYGIRADRRKQRNGQMFVGRRNRNLRQLPARKRVCLHRYR